MKEAKILAKHEVRPHKRAQLGACRLSEKNKKSGFYIYIYILCF